MSSTNHKLKYMIAILFLHVSLMPTNVDKKFIHPWHQKENLKHITSIVVFHAHVRWYFKTNNVDIDKSLAHWNVYKEDKH